MDFAKLWAPLLALGWIALAHLWLFSWSRPDVERWIDEHGFQLIYSRRLYFRFGEAAYKIIVVDRSGSKRAAIMHAPSILNSLFGMGREIKVRWLD